MHQFCFNKNVPQAVWLIDAVKMLVNFEAWTASCSCETSSNCMIALSVAFHSLSYKLLCTDVHLEHHLLMQLHH